MTDLINTDYYKDQEFQDKVRFYMVKAAIAVMAEDKQEPYHDERAAYATKVLNGIASVSTYSLGVSCNDTIKAKIDAGDNYDTDLEFVVNSLFTAYAGGAS